MAESTSKPPARPRYGGDMYLIADLVALWSMAIPDYCTVFG